MRLRGKSKHQHPWLRFVSTLVQLGHDMKAETDRVRLAENLLDHLELARLVADVDRLTQSANDRLVALDGREGAPPVAECEAYLSQAVALRDRLQALSGKG